MVESEVAERDEKKNKNEGERHGEDEIMATVTEYILTQYNLKWGFEKFEKKAKEATENEISTNSQHGCIITIGCK